MDVVRVLGAGWVGGWLGGLLCGVVADVAGTWERG